VNKEETTDGYGTSKRSTFLFLTKRLLFLTMTCNPTVYCSPPITSNIVRTAASKISLDVMIDSNHCSYWKTTVSVVCIMWQLVQKLFMIVCTDSNAEPEERPPVPPAGGEPGKTVTPNLTEYLCYGIQRHQNWTHQELILHISPFNVHIYLIRQRNWSSHDPYLPKANRCEMDCEQLRCQHLPW